MKKKLLIILAAVITLGLTLASVTQAEPADRADRQRIQDFKVWKLMRILELSSDQSARFMPVFNELEKLRSGFIESKQAIFRKVEPLLDNKNPDQNQIDRLLNDLDKEEHNFLRQKDELQSNLFKIITPAQRAKYLRFEMEFPRMLRDMIKERSNPDNMRGGNGDDQTDNQRPMRPTQRRWD